jgi:hypothetical protein
MTRNSRESDPQFHVIIFHVRALAAALDADDEAVVAAAEDEEESPATGTSSL